MNEKTTRSYHIAPGLSISLTGSIRGDKTAPKISAKIPVNFLEEEYR